MITLNGNVLCAMDVETTGTIAGYHEITQVCFLPLDSNLKPDPQYVPFDILLKIEHEGRINWDALRVTKVNFVKHQIEAYDKYRAADLFEEWMERFELPFNKRLMPLAHNWIFDQAFIKDWLQPTAFSNYIDGRYRDTMVLAAGINDIYDRLCEPTPFPKINLEYLCSQLKVINMSAHNALGDCAATAEVYKKLITKGYLDGTK